MLSSGEAQFSLNQVKCFARLKANRRPKEPQQQHHLFKSKENWTSKGVKRGGREGGKQAEARDLFRKCQRFGAEDRSQSQLSI